MNSPSFWPDLLKQFSQEILADPDFQDGTLSEFISAEQRTSGWLGAPGATEDDLQELEHRLGCALPPSYRQFLAISNGFGPIDYFIWKLQSVAEVDWLINTEKELVEIWEKGASREGGATLDGDYFLPENMQNARYTRGEYLHGCLMVSDGGDGGFLALNPAVQWDGEWEAWHFANWNPGATRYRSFAELMSQTLDNYRGIKQAE